MRLGNGGRREGSGEKVAGEDPWRIMRRHDDGTDKETGSLANVATIDALGFVSFFYIELCNTIYYI